MTIRSINNWKTVLTASLASEATSAYVSAAAATLIENQYPSEGYPIRMTLENGSDMEIIDCTGANGTTGELTIIREREYTSSPTTFPAGAEIETRITAEMIDRGQGVIYLLGTKTTDFQIPLESGGRLFLKVTNSTGSINIQFPSITDGLGCHKLDMFIMNMRAGAMNLTFINPDGGGIYVNGSSITPLALATAYTAKLECETYFDPNSNKPNWFVKSVVFPDGGWDGI